MAKKETQDKTVKFGWLKEILTLIDIYGFIKIIAASLLMVWVGYATYLTFHPEEIFERYSAYEKKEHTESFNKRMNNTPIVQEYLNDLLFETNAYRGFIIELHNGKYNSAGLSFNYGSLTYEALNDSAESIREDYSDFSIERFPIINKVYKDGYWGGTAEELSKIDNRLSLRLMSNNASRMSVIMLYGSKEPIGFLGITSKNTDGINDEKIKKALHKYSLKISILLDGEKNNE